MVGINLGDFKVIRYFGSSYFGSGYILGVATY